MVSEGLSEVIKGSNNIFLLDYSWLLHRNYNIFKSMSAGEGGRPTGHIFGILSTIELIRKVIPDSVIILCKDGFPKQRRQILESSGVHYKSGRSELEYDFYKDIPLITALSFLLPRVYEAYDADRESDDIMFALSKQIHEVDNSIKVFIYSGDNDLLQAIDDNTVVVRHYSRDGGFEEIDNRVLVTDEKLVRKFLGVDSYHLPIYRAIVGDRSDTLPGIPRFPRLFAKELSMSSSSLDDLFSFCTQNIDKFKGTKRKYIEMVLGEFKDTIQLNYKVMKLGSDFNVPISRKKVNKEKALKYIDDLKLNKYKSFLKWLKLI